MHTGADGSARSQQKPRHDGGRAGRVSSEGMKDRRANAPPADAVPGLGPMWTPRSAAADLRCVRPRYRWRPIVHWRMAGVYSDLGGVSRLARHSGEHLACSEVTPIIMRVSFALVAFVAASVTATVHTRSRVDPIPTYPTVESASPGPRCLRSFSYTEATPVARPNSAKSACPNVLAALNQGGTTTGNYA